MDKVAAFIAPSKKTACIKMYNFVGTQRISKLDLIVQFWQWNLHKTYSKVIFILFLLCLRL